MVTYPVRTRRWTRSEYHRLAEVGVLRDNEPVELIGGELIVAEPKGRPHQIAVHLVAEALKRAFGDGWFVLDQGSFELDDDSEPEPDVQVLAGAPRDYLDDRPRRPALVVEVSDSSLAFDRSRKAGLYARAGVTDYWILNLIDRILEISRDPRRDPAGDFGWRYASVTIHRVGDVVSPLARLEAPIAVGDLLP